MGVVAALFGVGAALAAGRLVGDELAVVDDGDAIAKLLGLFEVMGGEHHCDPVPIHLADQAPAVPFSAAQRDEDLENQRLERQESIGAHVVTIASE